MSNRWIWLACATICLNGCGSSKFDDAQTDAIGEIAGKSAEAAILDSAELKAANDRIDDLEDRLNRANIPE